MRIRWRILAAVHGTVLILVCFSAGYGADPDGAQRAIAKAYKLRMRDPDAAISAYSEAIRLDPKNVEAYIGRSCVYQGKGDFDRAIADATEAIRLGPKLE